MNRTFVVFKFTLQYWAEFRGVLVIDTTPQLLRQNLLSLLSGHTRDSPPEMKRGRHAEFNVCSVIQANDHYIQLTAANSGVLGLPSCPFSSDFVLICAIWKNQFTQQKGPTICLPNSTMGAPLVASPKLLLSSRIGIGLEGAANRIPPETMPGLRSPLPLRTTVW